MGKVLPKSEPVDVIIVNYNAGGMLGRAVKCLQDQSHKNFQAWVVDNASTDGSLDCVPKDDQRFHTVKLKSNEGFSRANNIGAALGKSAWIACLNPDAFAEPDWLKNLLKAVKAYPEMVMAGSTQLSVHDSNLLDGAGDLLSPIGFAWRGLYRRPRKLLPPTGEVFGPCAAAALYRRDVFEAVGGFDESFFCYHEDVDLAFRLRLIGGKAIQVKEAVVHHVGSGVSGVESPFAIYHGTRNRSWTFVKNMPLPLLVISTPFHIMFSLLFLLRSVFKGRFEPTYLGIISSIKGLPDVWKIRQQVQAGRTCSVWGILRIMTWSPIRFFSRDADVRRLGSRSVN